MRTELFISWRYLLTKRKERFISLISVISVLGIAIGVMALIVVLAVMTGFDIDLRNKIVGNYSHITLTGFKPIDEAEYDAILQKIAPNPHVAGISPYIQGQVLVREGDRFFAVGIKGINPLTEPQVTRMAEYLLKCSLDDLNDDKIFIGKELAVYLGLAPGEELTVISPLGKEFKLALAGTFASGMYDYDMNLMFANLATVQKMLGLDRQTTAVAIKLDNMFAADEVRRLLARELKFEYNMKTWMEANQNFFAALKLEKLTMFIILTLIILVAAFNIASTLIVMVVEKTKDIGILKSLGFTRGAIRTVFMLEGIIIGGLGTCAGTAGGVGLCMLLKKYQFIKLPQDIYYLDHLPVSLQWPDIAWILGAALAIVLFSTVYPACKASQMQPVEALRYE